ncbi:hypothetical protein [Clostridium tetani]|uniref:Uncharacterized protein n=1 Tax=Clostridium tetani TaxID=1513 RepID=A0A4Q0VD30_CLOTA|nr:hypothetical protein [Clostridium tetani]CDI49919.1 hypothetical protein BN906_01927 [Clostridium tetani 12124569]KGI44200.1 hypothetical protein KY55_04520 [Clostridium tetani]KHO38605.1 hypothetical protein OR62_09345 [Clostridium tetani]RXI39988.1 hypothetical protein DP129_04520 [Clostridium tetani]RXI45827.1 hypothetical protein DP126_06460 [Clostridium tetani]
MILFTIFILILSIFEIKVMLKKDLKNELKVFILLTLTTLSLGYLYISNPYRRGFADIILTFFGIKY